MSKRQGDSYYKKAKSSGYLARSVFKLEEIDKKFNLFGKNKTLSVIDLGAAPGSWLQYVSSRLSSDSKILGIDVSEIKYTAPNMLTKTVDVFSNELDTIIETEFPNGIDIVLSDMAPKTTGIRVKDQYASYELVSRALDIAKKYLVLDGVLVVKIFQGEYFSRFLAELKTVFINVKSFKPKSSRSKSYEIYLVSRGKK